MKVTWVDEVELFVSHVVELLIQIRDLLYSNRPQIIDRIKGSHSRGEEREERLYKDYRKVIKENKKPISHPQ